VWGSRPAASVIGTGWRALSPPTSCTLRPFHIRRGSVLTLCRRCALQGVEIQSWVARASAANVAAASQPFLHDDHVVGPLAAALDAAAPPKEAGASAAAAPPKEAGAPAAAAPQPQAGVAATAAEAASTAAAAASTPPLTVSQAAAAAAATAALSQSNEEDHEVVHDMGKEQSSPNVQPGAHCCGCNHGRSCRVLMSIAISACHARASRPGCGILLPHNIGVS